MQTNHARRWVGGLLGAVVFLSLFARATPDNQSKGLIVAEAMVSMRQAVSIATMGLHSVSPQDRRISAQALLNLLEGEEGEHYDPAVDGPLELPEGLLSHLAQLASDSANESGSEAGRVETAIDALRTVLAAMLAVTSGHLSERAETNAFLETLASISSAYTTFQELLRDWEYEIWVRAGESIQHAIARAWPGAVVMIEPGVYRETLEIFEGLTLRGAAPGVILEPPAGQDGVVVRASHELGITLEDLAVRKAGTGIRALSNAGCLIAEVEVSECETGVEATDAAELTLSECTLRGNVTALRALGESTMALSDCAIEGSTGGGAAVALGGSASASIDRTDIVEGSGVGVLAGDSSELYIQDSFIGWNDLDGMVVSADAAAYVDAVRFHGNGGFGLHAIHAACPSAALPSTPPHTGEIYCSRCSFGDASSGTANALGALCPTSLRCSGI